MHREDLLGRENSVCKVTEEKDKSMIEVISMF